MPSRAPYEVLAVTAPGLELVTLAELESLGATRTRTIPGGVEFDAGRELLYAANLHLRSASRLLVRFACFRATSFAELERRSRRLAWESVIPPGSVVRLRVTCRKSRLYHSDAVAARIHESLAARSGATLTPSTPGPAGSPDGDEEEPPGQLIVVRLDHDECLISVDATGAHLHQRGYRRAVTQAPMRESLAAALLLASEWDVETPLIDPFCGSGTIAIEAALMARRLAPGLHRDFRCREWPDFDAAAWDRVVARAREAERPSAPAPIVGSDRSAAAIRAAGENAARAGVENDIAFERRDVSRAEPPAGPPGWIVTNPPYGIRLGRRDDVGGLHAAFGNVLRERFGGWQLGVLTADRRATARLRLPLGEGLRTTNGGIRVHFQLGTIVAEEHAGRR